MDRISRMRQNQLTNELDTCTPSVEMSKINTPGYNTYSKKKKTTQNFLFEYLIRLIKNLYIIFYVHVRHNANVDYN